MIDNSFKHRDIGFSVDEIRACNERDKLKIALGRVNRLILENKSYIRKLKSEDKQTTYAEKKKTINCIYKEEIETRLSIVTENDKIRSLQREIASFLEIKKEDLDLIVMNYISN